MTLTRRQKLIGAAVITLVITALITVGLSMVSLIYIYKAKKSVEGWTELHCAARTGDIERAKLALSNGANINARDESGKTSLHWAVWDHEKEFAEFIIANGADVNAKDFEGWTPLHETSSNESLDFIELLIENGANVNARTNEGHTLLHELAFSGLCGYSSHRSSYCDSLSPETVADVELLITRGAKVNARDKYGMTPFKIATDKEFKGYAELLSRHGGKDLGARKYNIFYEAEVGHIDNVRSILQLDPELLNARDKYRWTPLMKAASYGKKDMVEFLISEGADITLSSAQGMDPLFFATLMGNWDICKILIEHGADVNLKDKQDRTVLGRAASRAPKEIIELMVSHGADIKVRDWSGRTPLHEAASAGTTDIAKFLIEKGADVNARTNPGWAPLHFAAQKGHFDTCKLLLGHGADENFKGRKTIKDQPSIEVTPLDLALENGHQEIVELLRQHGALESGH